MKLFSSRATAVQILAGVACLAGPWVFSSCTTADPETDAFYHRGWLWPRSLEKPYEGDMPSEDVSVRRKVVPTSPGAFD